MAVTVFFFGLYGAVYNLASGYPYVSYTLSAILFLFLLTIPILSMRILADEKKQKTDQLILMLRFLLVRSYWANILQWQLFS